MGWPKANGAEGAVVPGTGVLVAEPPDEGAGVAPKLNGRLVDALDVSAGLTGGKVNGAGADGVALTSAPFVGGATTLAGVAAACGIAKSELAGCDAALG